MDKWYIKNDRISELYKKLQDVASQVIERPPTIDDQDVQGPADTYLSQDDMTLWLKGHNKRNRMDLFFVEVGEDSKDTIARRSLEDLSVLYGNLLVMDAEDGSFDGVIQNIPEVLEVFPLNEDLSNDIEQYRGGIFSVTASERHGGGWEGTA